MNKEIEINEWIESFLNGELAEDERALFRKKMEEDPVFTREVEKHRHLREIITDGAYLGIKNELRLIHFKKTKIARIKRNTGIGLGGLIIGVFLLLIRPDVNRESVQHEPPVPVSEDSGNVQVQKNQPSGNSETTDVIGSLVPSVEKVILNDEERNQYVGLDTLFAPEITEIPASEDETQQVKIIPEPDDNDISHPAKPESIAKEDCRKIKITGNFVESESCIDKPTGSITIDRQSVTGGLWPYAFSLSEVNFRDTVLFSGLYPGSYALYAKDANDCISRIGTALIRSVDCINTYQAVFAPLRGEIWTIPADPDRDGILNIFSRSGALVYSIRFTVGELLTWSGATFSGQALPMGIYPFEIRYTDGGSFIGNVTIVR